MTMKKPLWAPWPSFDRAIANAVRGVLLSGNVNQWTGPHVYAFEKAYAQSLGVKHPIDSMKSVLKKAAVR